LDGILFIDRLSRLKGAGQEKIRRSLEVDEHAI
jgi:hypothetical protein